MCLWLKLFIYVFFQDYFKFGPENRVFFCLKALCHTKFKLSKLSVIIAEFSLNCNEDKV